MLDFDLTGNVAALRFSLMTEQGRYAWYPHESVLRADELVNVRKSWPEKIDPAILRDMDTGRPVLDALPAYLDRQ